eukprot:jgi/Botrbrau1/18437/Bobra.0072s0025.1
MQSLSRYLWSAMGSGKSGGCAKGETPELEETDQVDCNASPSTNTDAFDKVEKQFCGDSAYVGSRRQSMDTSAGGSVASSQRRSRAFSVGSSYPSQSSMRPDGEGMSAWGNSSAGDALEDVNTAFLGKIGEALDHENETREEVGNAPESYESWNQRNSIDSCGGGSTRSGRSSFALERASFEANRKSLEMFGVDSAGRAGRGSNAGNVLSMAQLCMEVGVRGVAAERYMALCVVPNDTPLPMSMLSRLWRTTEDDAEATASMFDEKGIMRVASLYDGSAWGLVSPQVLQALQAACAATAVSHHQRLLAAYASQGHGMPAMQWADIPDDGYIMQNLGHHLVCAERLTDVRSLLANPAWLEVKLLSYGTGAVVADFRRYLMSQADEEVKMLLEAFQMSVPACLAHPTVSMLRSQMAGRLIGIQIAKQMQGPLLAPAPPLMDGDCRVRCLETKTASLEQAGGLQRMTLRGHTAAVHKVLLTPGGIDVITVSADGTARVWDLEIGDCMLLLDGHEGPVTDMAVSSTGAYLLTGSVDGTARLWELERGECLYVLSGHSGPVNGVGIDAEGRLAITVSSDGTARTWDLSNGKCRHVLPHQSHGGLRTVSRVALTPNNQVAITTGEDFLGRVWELGSGMCIAVLTGHTGWVVDVVITPDGQHCITASHDFSAIVWELPSFRKGPTRVVEPMHRLTGHTARVNAVRVTGMGTIAVTASDDFTARVWDWPTGTCREVLAGHGAWVSSVALAASGSVGVTVSGDETGVVWDLSTAGFLKVLEGHSGEVRSVVLTRHGRFAVTGSDDGTGRIWDLHARTVNTRRTHVGPVHCLLQTPDGDSVISVGNNGALVWDPVAGDCKAVLSSDDKSSMRWANVARNGELLITCCADRTVHVWDLQMGKLLRTLASHRGSRVKSFAASGDGSVAVIVLFDSTVSVWDLESMECRHMLQRWGDRNALHVHSSAVNAGYLANNATNALTVSKDATARVWDLDTGSCIHVLQGHTDGIEMASMDVQGELAMTVSYDKSARVWDLLHGECLGLVRQGLAVKLGSLAPDGTGAVLAFEDHTLALWELQSNCLLHSFQGHQGEITSLTWSPDSTYVASTSQDWTCRIWDVCAGMLYAFFMADSGLTSSLFTGGFPPDTLVVGSERGVVHFLALPPWPKQRVPLLHDLAPAAPPQGHLPQNPAGW